MATILNPTGPATPYVKGANYDKGLYDLQRLGGYKGTFDQWQSEWNKRMTSPAPIDPNGNVIGGTAVNRPATPAPTTPAMPATPPASNAAMVDALRQKPARFAGFGMGTMPAQTMNTGAAANNAVKTNTVANPSQFGQPKAFGALF